MTACWNSRGARPIKKHARGVLFLYLSNGVAVAADSVRLQQRFRMADDILNGKAEFGEQLVRRR